MFDEKENAALIAEAAQVRIDAQEQAKREACFLIAASMENVYKAWIPCSKLKHPDEGMQCWVLVFWKSRDCRTGKYTCQATFENGHWRREDYGDDSIRFNVYDADDENYDPDCDTVIAWFPLPNMWEGEL